MKQELNFDLEINEITRGYLEQIAKDIQKDVKENTPVDTWELQDHILISDIEDNWTSMEQKVYTDLWDVHYAWYVELWVKWQKYNYNVWWTTKTQVWAKMYEETFKNYQIALWNILK